MADWNTYEYLHGLRIILNPKEGLVFIVLAYDTIC